LVEKCRHDLNPLDRDFDSKISDFLAELIGVFYLHKNGFADFQFLLPRGRQTPDIAARKEARDYLIEVKNLRAPTSITSVAFSRFHRKWIEDPKRFNFVAELDFQSQVEPDLEDDQVLALKRIVMNYRKEQGRANFKSNFQRDFESASS